MRGRRAWQSQKPPQPPPPPTFSQSIDVNEFGADAFHFIYFFLLFWRLCKGDESWRKEGRGGENYQGNLHLAFSCAKCGETRKLLAKSDVMT